MLVPSAAGYNWPSIFLFLLTTTLVYMVYNSLSHADLRQTREVLDLLREDEKKIRDLSFRDPLTGAWNRRFMDETLPHVCALATRDSRPISFIMTDLDHFKSINDRFGHPVGDLVLTGVSRAILDCVRESDLVFRYGGDEFAALLPNTDAATAESIVQRIHTRVEEYHRAHGATPIRLSIGTATAEKKDLLDAFMQADRRMYEDKAKKREKTP
jgi:diguanylate cyclase (GGDEF)-like protein